MTNMKTTPLYISGTDGKFSAVEKTLEGSVCYKERVEDIREDKTYTIYTRLSCPKEGWSVKARNDDFEWSEYEGVTTVERLDLTKTLEGSVCYKERVEDIREDKTCTIYTRLSCPREGWSVKARNDDFEWSEYEGVTTVERLDLTKTLEGIIKNVGSVGYGTVTFDVVTLKDDIKYTHAIKF